jgi:dUTP pyrophosphatase
MNQKIRIKFKRLSDAFADIPLPEYQTPDSSGMDIRAAIDEPMMLEPHQVALVPTGLAVEIPQGYEIQVRPRSGLAAKYGIGIANAPGTIDADYRGEIKVLLINYNSVPYELERGTRIAQLVLTKIYQADIEEADELNDSFRGEGGFGHTGLN